MVVKRKLHTNFAYVHIEMYTFKQSLNNTLEVSSIDWFIETKQRYENKNVYRVIKFTG